MLLMGVRCIRLWNWRSPFSPKPSFSAHSIRPPALTLLTHRFGELPQADRDHIKSLPLETLEELGKALLDFEELVALQAWLGALSAESE